jgi:TPP-dependent pyruvate/acetoin dehydrogenase alpha subunit
MQFLRKNNTNEVLVDLYKSILFPRLIEEKMLVLLRQGRISKWFSGIGQEAIAVGVTKALDMDEWVMPLHRNLGVFTTRNMPLSKLFKQWQGNKDGYSKGRERSFHFGSKEHHICGMISHLGPQLALADGVALAHKLNYEPFIICPKSMMTCWASTAKLFNVSGYPTNIIINQDGNIQYVSLGVGPNNKERLTEEIKKLLLK